MQPPGPQGGPPQPPIKTANNDPKTPLGGSNECPTGQVKVICKPGINSINSCHSPAEAREVVKSALAAPQFSPEKLTCTVAGAPVTPDQPGTKQACTPVKTTACAQGSVPWRCGSATGTLSGCAIDASQSTRTALLYNCKAVGELELPAKDDCDPMPAPKAMAMLAPAGDTQLAGLGAPPPLKLPGCVTN